MDAEKINNFSDDKQSCHEAGTTELCTSFEGQIEKPSVNSTLERAHRKMNIADAARKYFGPENGIDLDLSRDWSERPPVDFSDFDV